MVALTDQCFRCGYSLLGIGDETPCPECGLLARRSRRTTDELRFTRPRWLRCISRGTNFLLLAVLLLTASPVLSVLLARVGNKMVPIRAANSAMSGLPLLKLLGFNVMSALPLIPLLGQDAAVLCLLAGSWLLSSREGYAPADRTDRWRRWSLRAVALAPIVAVIAKNVERYLLFNGGYWGVYDRGWHPIMTTMIVAGASLVPLPLLLFALLRGLATRTRSAHLAEHCAIVGVGASSVLASFLAVVFVALNAHRWGLGDHWIDRSIIGMALLLVLSVAGLLFALWSIYLLVRFALALRCASKQLARDWRADDRAGVSTHENAAPLRAAAS